jgi:hypothetical protein
LGNIKNGSFVLPFFIETSAKALRTSDMTDLLL